MQVSTSLSSRKVAPAVSIHLPHPGPQLSGRVLVKESHVSVSGESPQALPPQHNLPVSVLTTSNPRALQSEHPSMCTASVVRRTGAVVLNCHHTRSPTDVYTLCRVHAYTNILHYIEHPPRQPPYSCSLTSAAVGGCFYRFMYACASRQNVSKSASRFSLLCNTSPLYSICYPLPIPAANHDGL